MKFPYATCALMLVIQASVWAQAVNGTIVGTITDESGGLVPAAQVTITEANTNSTRLVTSDGNGYFSFPDLPPGTYNVKVAKQGFTTAERTQAASGANTTVRVQMELRGPGFFNLDAALFRNVRLTENFNLQFRTDWYSATNTPQFNNPGLTLGDATFGRITGAGGTRGIDIGLKLSF